MFAFVNIKPTLSIVILNVNFVINSEILGIEVVFFHVISLKTGNGYKTVITVIDS